MLCLELFGGSYNRPGRDSQGALQRPAKLLVVPSVRMERPDKLEHHIITNEGLSDDYLSARGSGAREFSGGFQFTVLVSEGNSRLVVMSLDDKLLAKATYLSQG
jgi:hypothetical protein